VFAHGNEASIYLEPIHVRALALAYGVPPASWHDPAWGVQLAVVALEKLVTALPATITLANAGPQGRPMLTIRISAKSL